MSKAEQEIEVKLFVRDLAPIAARLQTIGARLTGTRVLETNLRFDTPDGALTREHRVLRLRQDTAAVMTFKGAAQEGQTVSMRQEIEFQVSDFDAARHLLEALGYRVSVIYEKYRTTYWLGDLMITLDEMPFGNFVEIEGPEAASIEKTAQSLHLKWDARSSASYLALFDEFRKTRGLSVRNLTFAEVQGVKAAPRDLGLEYAD